METPLLFELQAAKAIEYMLVFGFLLLFVPFWRYVAPRRTVEEEEEAIEVVPAHQGLLGWFRVPEALAFHPGHVWASASPAGDGDVRLGIDDLARAVIGHVADVKLPRVGSVVRRGEPLFTLTGEGGPVTLRSPVDGMVVAANPAARLGAVDADPYEGWVLRVQAPHYAEDDKRLLRGEAARRWMAEAEAKLRAIVSPELGPALADGGAPVHGIAAALDEEGRKRLAREIFLDGLDGIDEVNEGTTGTTKASA